MTVAPTEGWPSDPLGALCDLLTATVEQPHPEVVTIAVFGELDMATGDLFARAIDNALARAPQRIIIDLSDVTFCGSTGLNLLTRARAMASHQGIKLFLRGAERRVVAAPLQFSGLVSLFDYVT